MGGSYLKVGAARPPPSLLSLLLPKGSSRESAALLARRSLSHYSLRSYPSAAPKAASAAPTRVPAITAPTLYLQGHMVL